MTLIRSRELTKDPVCIISNFCIDLIIRNASAMRAWGQEENGTNHMLISSGQTGYTDFTLHRLDIPTTVVGSNGICEQQTRNRRFALLRY